MNNDNEYRVVFYISNSVHTSCRSGEFTCSNSSQCIPGHYVCDGWNDCGDDSDEVDCPCDRGMFTCLTYNVSTTHDKCVGFADLCDGVDDCSDGSDEINCNCTGQANMTQ